MVLSRFIYLISTKALFQEGFLITKTDYTTMHMNTDFDQTELTTLIKNSFINLTERQICDLEMIMIGGFAPLATFLGEEDYKKVVSDMRLADGSLWPMPIVLAINGEKKEELEGKDAVVLKDQQGVPLAIMNLVDVYKPDLEFECEKVYGTTDTNHPYVKLLLEQGELWYISGPLTLINHPKRLDFKDLRKSPEQTKQYFKDKGWKKVIGFQTRNPIHKSHFHSTLNALDEIGKDARLLVHPVVGETQDKDVDYHVRVKCYKEVMSHYPENKASLALLPLSMRMAGPREALWHALIRKNYGCTHFIIGRDHAGPSASTKEGEDFYGDFDAYELAKKYEDEIGITIIPSGMVCYVADRDEYVDTTKVKEIDNVLHLKGRELRRKLRDGEDIPEWFTFANVANELTRQYKPRKKGGFCVYLVGLSGSGKSTLASALEAKLREIEHDRKITRLDGDVLRLHLTSELGFSKEDRSKSVRRAGYVASEIVKHGGIALSAQIAPYEVDRQYNRDQIAHHGGYVEIFVNTSLEACEERDIKGLYKAAREGKIEHFTGISDPFEEPENAELMVNGEDNLDELVDTVISYLEKEGYVEV